MMLFRVLVVALSIPAIIELRRSGLAAAITAPARLFLLIDTFAGAAGAIEEDEDINCDFILLELDEFFIRLSVDMSAIELPTEELFAGIDDDGGSGGGGGGGGVRGANEGGNGGGEAFGGGGGGSGGNGGCAKVSIITSSATTKSSSCVTTRGCCIPSSPINKLLELTTSPIDSCTIIS